MVVLVVVRRSCGKVVVVIMVMMNDVMGVLQCGGSDIVMVAVVVL